MKGRIMNIKTAEQDRVARYGIALGGLLYTMWRGLVRVFVPGEFESHRVRGCRGSL
jgi:hypothetical protein